MASQLAANAAYVVVLLMWIAVIGTVERRERYLFAAGVFVLLVAQSLLSGTAGAVVAVVGIAAVVVAALPLLAEPPAET